jgi:ABC-type uncharacterized transport system involved in gliding motility auxiliary subunit
MKPESPSARSSRRSASLQNLLKLALAVFILLLINMLGFKHYRHKDLSESQFYSISPKTRDVLKKLDGPLHIYTFLNPQATGQNQQIENLLLEYVDAGKPNVIVEKIDPAYDQKRALDLYKELHFDGDEHLLIFQYKKDQTPRFVKQEELFDVNPMNGQVGAFKGEQQITSAITALIEGKSSKVYFTEGHGEHSIHDLNTLQGYGMLEALLKNENVESTTINLGQKGEVPADADALVIAGPSIAFSTVDAEAVEKYLAANGKLLVLYDPYVTVGPLDAVLQKYGIKYEDDTVLYRALTPSGTESTYPIAFIYQGGFSAQPITTKFAQAGLQMGLENARSITLPAANGPTPSKTQFLLQTDQDAWGWISKSGPIPTDIRTLTYNKVTDIPGPVTVAAQYDGGTTTDPTTKATMFATRIVAVGASKFLENDATPTSDTVGANFFTNAVDWLVKKDAVLDIAPKKPMQYGIALSGLSYTTLVWCAGVFVPGAALLLGVLTWFSRRK